jgi:outer membrane protein OmpA-like peptidoglycan-associated protein/tetratricopeptide (TPR) repeat protein
MKKSFFIVSVLLMATLTAQSQERGYYDKLVAEASRYFEEEQYHLAIELYNEALALDINDPAVDYKLAESYRNTFNYAEAEVYYLKVLYMGQSKFPLSLFYYALMLKLNGNVSEAMERLDQFIAFHQHNLTLKDFVEQAIIEKAGCEIAQQEFGLTVATRAELAEGNINTAFNDFAPAARDAQTLVITSSRVHSNRTLIDERYGEAFTDNYYFHRNGDVWEDKTRKEFSAVNTLYHDGSGAFTKKGDQYFFTICEAQCRIYETHLDNDKWSKPAPLNAAINHPQAESKQPAISAGGDTLYFASNRPGGYGQFDIWMSIDKGQNEWSTPVNAGRMINTRANDLAPAMADIPSVLFFSSEGHPGYGGFDLFVAKRSSTGDTVLYNLNLPFNSVKDDCFITFNGREAFWSSNRAEGKGGFDIYIGRKVSATGLVSMLSLKNRNDSRMVTLTSRTAQSENIHLLASRNEETIDYNNLTYERKSFVNRMVENRLNDVANNRAEFSDLSDEEFEMLDEISQVRFQVLLLKQKYASTLLTEVVRRTNAEGALAVTGELVDSHTGASLNFARVLLTNEYGEILKITSTNESGQFRFTDVPGDTKLFLRLESTSGRRVNAFVKNIQTRDSDKKNGLYVENVYFDFDHYVIRPEATQVLTELASFLKSNPGAQVEIHAFADDRGSSAYNFELTQKRGEAVVAFLTKSGVDETSLAIIPKGKQVMKRAANEIQRQYNRRAEFIINGVKEAITSSVKTYIVKKEADWTMIATLTGIPKEELKNLNGAQTDVVKAFQPIRLPLEAKTISEEVFFVGIWP